MALHVVHLENGIGSVVALGGETIRLILRAIFNGYEPESRTTRAQCNVVHNPVPPTALTAITLHCMHDTRCIVLLSVEFVCGQVGFNVFATGQL